MVNFIINLIIIITQYVASQGANRDCVFLLTLAVLCQELITSLNGLLELWGSEHYTESRSLS